VVEALGRMKECRALPSLIQAMRDPNGEVREAVVGALMQVGDAICIEVLVGGLKDLHSGVRRRAAKVLDFFGWRPANDIQTVMRFMAHGEYVKAAGVGVLAIEPLLNVLKDVHCPNRRDAVEALSHIGDERVLKPLINALKDEDALVRVAAIEGLGAIRDARSTDPLTLALKDQDPVVRAAAANALGKLREIGTFERLIAALKDGNWSVRKAAVDSLGRLKEPRGVGPLTELLKDPDHDVRGAVVDALGQIRHKSAVEHLVVALADSQASVRHVAAGVLCKLEPEWERTEAGRRAIPALKQAFTSKEYWVRQAAADTLSKLREMPRSEPSLNAFTDPVYYKRTAALHALVQALGDWDRDLRLAAAEALGRLADPRAIESLDRALGDADGWVRQSADNALRHLGRQRGVDSGLDALPGTGEPLALHSY
jgi:HEAT repeat protein